MTRAVWNLVIDLVTALAMGVVVVTGIVMEFVLPQGSPSRGLRLFGGHRHDWGEVHFWAAVALGALVVVHVWLHWAWVCKMVCRVTPGLDGRGPISVRTRRVVGTVTVLVIAGALTGVVYGGRALAVVGAPSAEHAGEGAQHGRTEGEGAAAANEGSRPEGSGEQRRRRGAR